mgnify:CR=1 FL=1
MKCPYCSRRAIKVRGDKIYPGRTDLSGKLFFLCPDCNAYVGTHERTGEPMGTMANRKLRAMRHEVHIFLNPLWEPDGYLRTLVYYQLARDMGLHPTKCHVAMFNEDQCLQAKKIVKTYTKEQFVEKKIKRERKRKWTRK